MTERLILFFFFFTFGLYNIYLQNKTKNKTVKEGGLVLKIMHDSCETNLPEEMAAGLRSLDNFSKKSALSRLFCTP